MFQSSSNSILSHSSHRRYSSGVLYSKYIHSCLHAFISAVSFCIVYHPNMLYSFCVKYPKISISNIVTITKTVNHIFSLQSGPEYIFWIRFICLIWACIPYIPFVLRDNGKIGPHGKEVEPYKPILRLP